MAIIYRKTEVGQAEIATRALRLPLRVRQALILVDGKRSDAELRKLIPPPADEALQALLDLECIEAVGGTAASAASAPATAAAPAQAAAPVVLTLVETCQRAVRWLSNNLGPYADPLSLRIEKAKNREDMRSALVLASSFVRQQRGAASATEFEQHVGLPPEAG
ncbi:MAG: hypothetical protein H0W48_13815 [Methylibium sp.]|uniref:hypothetical protein n=1 Tax=Methylibium sp. TaxID=2067992 RepID=UPI00181D6A9B|nr:hypothetical protein [Methylibium sp.]MBA2721490.1 hypothetical protein [Methylibium sp.]MBA3590437.1 hypothetical protein [Methylibium sp.]MBA3625496.1 hypothetical protein [Methylibium sp.]